MMTEEMTFLQYQTSYPCLPRLLIGRRKYGLSCVKRKKKITVKNHSKVLKQAAQRGCAVSIPTGFPVQTECRPVQVRLVSSLSLVWAVDWTGCFLRSLWTWITLILWFYYIWLQLCFALLFQKLWFCANSKTTCRFSGVHMLKYFMYFAFFVQIP